jgi:GntR family transcriptional regulator
MDAERASLEVFSGNRRISQETLPEVTANRIRAMIYSGELPPRSRLPSEPEIAHAIGVSRGTLRAALNLLKHQGLVWQRQGVGTFVSDRPLLENRLDINLGLTELIESKGLVPGSRHTEIKVVPADEHIAKLLQLAVETPLVFIRRIRTADERPVAASVDILDESNLKRGPLPLSVHEFEAALTSMHSLYRVLDEKLHIRLDHAIAKLRPIKVDSQLVKQLRIGVPSGSVMLYLEQIDYDRDRKPVVLSYEYHVADFSTFTIYRR